MYTNKNSNSFRQAVQDVEGGAKMSVRTQSRADGAAVIPDVLPKRKGYAPFGFNHTGADAGTADQIIAIGDTNGDIATALSITATAYATAVGCGVNAALNRQLDDEPVSIDKISLEMSSTTQKSKQILYAVLHPDGTVESKNVTPLFRAQKSNGVEQLTIQEVAFARPFKLGPNEGIFYYVGKDLNLEAMMHPVVSAR